MRKAIFLDRDGVINAMVYNREHGFIDSPSNPEQFQLLPGVGEAIRLINEMGFLALVVSNQPGVAKGKLTLKLLDAITQKMKDELAAYDAHLDRVGEVHVHMPARCFQATVAFGLAGNIGGYRTA